MNYFKNLLKTSKSKLDNKSVYHLASVTMMLDGWSIDNGFGGLSTSDRLLVIEKLLRWAGFSASKDEIDAVTMGMIAINPDYKILMIREMRVAHNFDVDAVGLCEKIQLPERLYSKHKSNLDTVSQKTIDDYAKEASIFPRIEDGNYNKFIVEISCDNVVFAAALNIEGGQGALEGFIDVIESRINNYDFQDPLSIVEDLYGRDPGIRRNLDAERVVIGSNKMVLFGWGSQK